MVPCPQCGELSEYSSANPYRPFCSERCRLIDLGQWASESYRIPDNNPKPDDSEEY
nr:DNA gyrase inhibitor YacG [Methylobacillus sp.]